MARRKRSDIFVPDEISATAVFLDVPLLTHNRKDYESLESPRKGPSA
jgi:hypothetical protein